MTEEIAGTPGWVEARLDEVFARLPGGAPATGAMTDGATGAARECAYEDCLARQKDPVAPSDDLGTDIMLAPVQLRVALEAAGVAGAAWATLDAELEALEAEITVERRCASVG